MEQAPTRHPDDKHPDQVSLSNGYWFYFQDDDLRIAAHGCGYSGKETVYVNDAPVVSGRNFGLSSRHRFQFGGNRYLVRFKLDSLWRGRLICILDKNGVHVATATRAYLPEGNAKKRLAGWIGVGFATGFLGAIIGALISDWLG